MAADTLSPKSKTFPWKLHEMLQLADKEGFGCIVSWLPDCKSFKVYEPVLFVQKIMPKFFHQSKYKSFQRQLNLWGFERIVAGSGKGGYTRTNHFFRHHPSEICYIKRRKIKSKGEGGVSRIKKLVVITPAKKTNENSNNRVMNQTHQSSSTASVVIVPTKDANPNENISSSMNPMELPMILPFSTASVISNNHSDVSSVSSESDWSQSSVYEPVILPTPMHKMDFSTTMLAEILEDEECPQTGDCMDFEGRSYFFVDEEEIKISNGTTSNDIALVQCRPTTQTACAMVENSLFSTTSENNCVHRDFSFRDFASPYVASSRV